MVWDVYLRLILASVLLIRHGRARTDFGNGSPGQACKMGGGVVGTCEEVEACLKDGGVVERRGVVKLCAQQNSKIYACCRRPHLITRGLCDAWSQYWREAGQCVNETQLIVGGVNAIIGEFPHIAILGAEHRYKGIDWFCGGTLISPHYILTAAHCVARTNNYWIRLSTTVTKRRENSPGSEGLFLHPSYTPQS
ncbi:phenoloxidase-activating factor 3-like [Homarus americanus]|uniref:phenoloxidase-activating factor 3-like n=1 Tax=Homarus americanus TaxID=6706 RepID=UPI001C45E7C2|nr:phenoloxidase-activating factor 3-like [Homarus americanus]